MMCWVYDAFYQEYSVHTILIITYTNNITNIILFKAKGSLHIYFTKLTSFTLSRQLQEV